MHHLSPPHPLDLVPAPDEIHRRIAAAARTQRLLRRLLRLALAARRERGAADSPAVPQAVLRPAGGEPLVPPADLAHP